jgi:hypothetical protein
MCPACLATLAMMVAGTASTGGLAAVLANKLRSKRAAKEEFQLAKASGLTQRRKSHEQGSHEQANGR